MKIMAAATARNILKDKEKRYNTARESINEIITRSAEFGEKETSVHITNLDSKHADKLLKELKDAGYILKKVEYTGRTRIGTRGFYVTINWAEV